MTEEDTDAGVAGEGSTSTHQRESSTSTSSARNNARPSPSDGKEDRQDTAKRPRRADVDMAARGKRMFGLLNSTLSKAKEDNARRSSGEAAKKRAEIEARLQEKLKAEEQIIKQNSTLAEDLKTHLLTAYNLSLDIHSTESMIRLRKAQKRRLASFMITPSESSRYDGDHAKKMAADGIVVAPDIATCIAPLPSRTPPDLPVYFLPKRMLPKQDDKLDDQEDRVDDAIEDADQAWEKQRSTMQATLDRTKDAIQAIREEMEQMEKGQKAPPADKDGE